MNRYKTMKIPIMAELEILKHRMEILEKGFQQIIALIKKEDKDRKNVGDCNKDIKRLRQCIGYSESYAPGSERCDFCEYKFI